MFGRMLFLLLFSASALAEGMAAPDAVVKQMVDEVLTPIKRDQQITHDPKRMDALVDASVFPRLDFVRLSRLTVGKKYWGSASPLAREQLVGEYHTFLLHVFADVIAQYTDQKILYLPFKMRPDAKDVKVKTVVMDPRDESTELDYKLEKMDAGWLIYDLDIDNMSVVRIYHSNFSATLSQGGVSELVRVLHEKNLKVEASRGS